MSREHRAPEYSLEALLGAANQRLASGRLPAADPRTGETLDVRTLRYYRTLGLVEAPLRYDGSRAVFGKKHLLQAIAIKALQRHGLSLAEAQRKLQKLAVPALEELVAGLLKAADKRKGSLLAESPHLHPLSLSLPAAAFAPSPSAGSGRAMTLDLAPGLTIHADLARAAEIVPCLEQARLRFEELLSLLARVSEPHCNPTTQNSPEGTQP